MRCMSLPCPAESVSSGRVWTPLTAAFSHADGWHLFANMLGLYFFGRWGMAGGQMGLAR